MPRDVPTTPREFLDRVHARSDSLPRRLRECADYLAANHDRIAVSTVAEIAQGAGVPPSAVMRFAQTMGFSGYAELQRMFRAALTTPRPDYESRLRTLQANGAGSPSALLAEFVESGRRSLGNLASTIDPRSLDMAVNRLAAAEMIHLMGLRRAFPVAAYFAYTFERMGFAAMLHGGVGMLSGLAAVRPGDAVLAITFNPYSPETVAFADAARDRGAEVVAITDTGLSPMRRIDAVALLVDETDFGAFRPLAATVTLAITLGVAIGTARGTKQNK